MDGGGGGYTSSSVYNKLSQCSPMNVAMKKGHTGTPIIGDAILINQLGKKGVIRKNII